MLKCAPEYLLSRRHTQAARRRVCFHLITALAHWEARGIIACVICNKREDPISKTTQLMCTVRVSLCKSWTHVAIHTNVTHIWALTAHSRAHKPTNQKQNILTDCDAAIKHIHAHFCLGESLFTFMFSSFSWPRSNPRTKPLLSEQMWIHRNSREINIEITH